MPEGVVLVHVERAGNAHGATGRVLGREHGAVKEQLALVLEEVRRLALLLGGLARALLAAVARDEAAAVAKGVDGEKAVVGAAPAVHVGVLDLQVVDLVAREQRRDARLARTVTGEKGGAVGAHGAGDVRTDDVAAGEKLEGAQRRIGHEGAALDDDVLADLVVVAQLDDLEQRVLDHGVREAGGDVADGRALLLRLLDAGVHEHGAAAAEVDGMLAADGRLGELLHGHAHGVGEVGDERPTARRAGLVEHDVLDDAVLDLEALHVLPADVEDEVHVGHEGLGAAEVGDGLDLAGVGLERLDEDALAVARGGHMTDGAALGEMVVDVVHDLARGAENVAVVVVVPGVEQLARLADHGGLHRGRARVDADEHAAVVAVEGALGHDLGVMAGLEVLVVLLGGEERVQARDLGSLGVTEVVEAVDDLGEGDVAVRLAGEGGTRGDEEVGVFGDDAVLLVEVERLVEALAKRGEVLERAAEERDVAADGVAAGEAGDRLVGDGLEDGGSDVLAGGALVEQGLDVGLGKDAAAAGDGIDVRGTLRELVEAHGVGLHERGHLVDEGARAAGAGAVHALLDAVVEVDDLGVLAAELDGAVGLRDERLHGALGGDDLLDELEVEPLGEKHAAGAGDRDAHGRVAEDALGLLEDLARRCLDVGVVAFVVGIDEVAALVDDGQLDRRRSHVDAQSQACVREVDGVLGRELRPVLHELDARTGRLLCGEG